MDDLKINRDLAISYFEGEITFTGEKELFDFISKSKENMQHFRSWEAEWEESYVENALVTRKWKEIQEKLILTEDEPVKNTDSAGSRFFQLSSWVKYLSVAAVVALVAGATLFLQRVATEIKPQQYVSIEAPLGQMSKVTLADGTLVWLNAGSTIQYPSQLNKKNFQVSLSGEAFFDVAEQKRGKFIVITDDCRVEVIGTKFNLTAYPDDEYITTTLLEGKVNVFNGSSVTELNPGETASINRLTGEVQKSSFDISNAGSWINNDIIYDNISLTELGIKLERQYNVTIHLMSKTLADKQFSLSLRNNETIDDVMLGLEKILQIKIDKKGTEYFIQEK